MAESTCRPGQPSADHLASLLEASPALFWQSDRGGRLTWLNPAWSGLLGLPLADLLGRPLADLARPSEAPMIRAAFDGLAHDGTALPFAATLTGSDGWPRYLVFHPQPCRDADGRLLGAQGTAFDRTDIHQAEVVNQVHREIVRSLSEATSIPEGAERVLQAVLQLDCLDCGGVYCADPTDGSLSLVAHRGLSSGFVQAVSYYPAEAERVRMVRTGEFRFGTFAGIHPHAPPAILAEGLRATAILPIMDQTDLIAVFNLGSHVYDAIPPATQQALQTIALQIRGLLLRLRTDEALRESEEIFRQFMQHSPIYVFFKDDQARPIRLSSNYATMLGRPLEEILGRRMHELFPPDLAASMEADDLRVMAEGKPFSVIEEFGGRWYSTVKFPIDLQGRPRFLAGYTIDITDRKLAEEAVAAEKERLAVTLRSIGDGVITTDTHGRVDLLNRVAEKLTGWTQEEAQGQPLSEVFRIVHALTRQPRPSPFDQILAAGGTIELEGQTLLLARDGSERPVADSGAPIKDRHDNVIGVVLVFRDMTQEQRMLDNLRRIDKLDSLGVLAGGIAHDFNNLLCGILGHVDLARLLSRSHPEITHHLEAAISVFHRARDLTQQLLTFSKGGAPRRHTGRLDTVITQCVAFALSGSTIRCQPVIAPDLWLCDFDENQIGQVIDNLIINALQAMPQGGRLAVSARNHSLVEGEIPSLPAGRYVEVIVSDSGVGIPPELLGRIFDPFFTTKQKGNGLGLSICHSIMRKHDGFITVESVLGQGTTFHLYFPASQQAMPRDTTAPPLPHRGTGRILIMDDEECIRHVMRCMLSTMGYTVVEARHGQEALDLFAAAKESGEPFRAAFFDLTIPGGMGGRETIVAVRRTHPNLPIFASSGYSDDPAMAHPQEFGFTDSIGKPYRLADLADLLRRHLKVCPT